jgi:hypothetical protein
MIFLASLGTSQSPEQFVINAASWSECLAYCEGTGQGILGIQYIPNTIINYNEIGTNCYNVTASKTLGSFENHYVWENSFDNLNTWIESQGFLSVQMVQFTNKAYVVV